MSNCVNPVPHVQSLRVYLLLFSIVMICLIVGSGIIWFRFRDDYRLKRRAGSLVFISALGVVFNIITGPMHSFLNQNMNCVLRYFAYFATTATLIWPITVRIILWRNGVKFNNKVAVLVGTSGIEKLNLADESLGSEIFYASRNFGLLLTLGVLIPIWIGSLLASILYVCRLCIDSSDFIYITSTIFGLVCLCIGAVLLYIYREIPDTIGIREETIYSFTCLLVLGLFAVIMRLADVGSFEEIEPRTFYWGMLVDHAMASFFFFTVPRPLWTVLRRRNESLESKKTDELDDILATKRGIQFFKLYLATELSIENILFYEAVVEWEEKYKNDSSAGFDEALLIFENFIKPGSSFEVNLSAKQKQIAERSFEAGPEKLEPRIFENVKNEIYRLMLNDSFSSFKRSDFFKLYNGEATPDIKQWITSSGYSSYSYIDVE